MTLSQCRICCKQSTLRDSSAKRNVNLAGQYVRMGAVLSMWNSYTLDAKICRAQMAHPFERRTITRVERTDETGDIDGPELFRERS